MAMIPDMNIKQFEKLVGIVEELKSYCAIDIKASVCCRVTSMQELPISKTVKEKLTKAGIGFQLLTIIIVFSK